MKLYSEISIIDMASSNDVYSISYTHDADEIETLINAEINDGEPLAEAVELCGFHTTKASAMESSYDAEVQGFGKYSGRKLWQLPVRLQADIKRQIKPRLIK